MSYPLVVVGLFKSIVVVDGKWVWDSWILKHRWGAEWKTCNVVRESLGKLFSQRQGLKTHRGRTFLNRKVKPTHLCLQPRLNVNIPCVKFKCVCVLLHWSKAQLQLPQTSQHYKNVQTTTLSQNTSHNFGLKVQNANRLCCLRACPASRVYMPIYETLTLTPIPRVSECVCPVG